MLNLPTETSAMVASSQRSKCNYNCDAKAFKGAVQKPKLQSRRNFLIASSFVNSKPAATVAATGENTNDEETSIADSMEMDSTQRSLFLLGLGIHWVLWSEVPTLALAWDIICIGDMLYNSSMSNNP